MLKHDKKEIEKLKKLKEQYIKDRENSLSKEEKINRFLKAMRGE